MFYFIFLWNVCEDLEKYTLVIRIPIKMNIKRNEIKKELIDNFVEFVWIGFVMGGENDVWKRKK